MSVQRDPDAILATWLEEGPTRLPDATRRAIAVSTATTHQARRPIWSSWRYPFMNTYAKLAITALVVVVVGAAGLALLGPGLSGLGGQVAPTPSPSPTPPPTSILVGTWGTQPTTCAQQNAALANAGYTAEQLGSGGWDSATCLGMTHGSVHTVQFKPDGAIVQLADGSLGWEGTYEVVDATTIRARGQGWTITYHYTIDGETLVIDMTQIDAPVGTPEADVWADRIAQTVIYESLPFTRQSSTPASAEASDDLGTPSPLQGRAESFPVPFAYTLPSGVGLVVSPDPRTNIWQFRHPGPQGGPGYDYGVIVRAVTGGRLNPCQDTSSPRPLPDPQAFIDYLKTIPTVTVSNVAPATIDGRPAMQAVLTFGQPTPACPDVWLFAEEGSITQNGLRQSFRVAFLDVDGTHVVILSNDKAASNDTERAFIESIRFDAPRSSPSTN